jgi:pyruvate kinase
MRRTKIVATIGPATISPETISSLLTAGMNVARLNGSHGDLDWHAAAITAIRDNAPGIPILLDVPGRKIRTVDLEREPKFLTGQIVILSTDLSNTTDVAPINYPHLHEQIKVGDTIFADDGTLRFSVVEVCGRNIHCRAETDGQLRSRKGINVPGITLKTELVTERDRLMLDFACSQEVDFVGISFVESKEHVEAIQSALGKNGPLVVSKIENQKGLDNMIEIIRATDAVMIDRGDLATETNLETVAISQKRIIEAAREYARPVIVATEILHTMIENPHPTKAEISDITNAVLDGCAATMLSGETAVGRYPIESVKVMARVATEASTYQDDLNSAKSSFVSDELKNSTLPRVTEEAIALICRSLPITKIVAVTVSGYAARALASRFPAQPILAISNDAAAVRTFGLYPGTEGIHLDIPFGKTSTDHIPVCLKALWRMGKLDSIDLVLVTAVGYPRSGNRMNLIQTHYLEDLIESMGWRE